jgi:hypothetical protein
VKREILSDLSAALSPQNIGACLAFESTAGAENPIARVRLGSISSGQVSIEVDDSLTNKRVTRDVVLRDASESAAALVIAVAIDELLRATWAELSLRNKQSPSVKEATPEPPAAPPAQPTAEPAATRQKASLPLHRLSLGASADVYIGGSTFWGGDLAYGSRIANAAEWTVFAGPRFTRSKSASAQGEVSAEALTFGFSGQVPLVHTGSFLFGPLISVAATHAWYRGRAEGTSEAQSLVDGEMRGWGVLLRGGAAIRWQFEHLYLAAHTELGAPILALEVTDSQKTVGGITGLEWSNSAALGFWWAQ